MKRFKCLILVLFLVGCQSAEEKKAEWVRFCVDGEFTPKQCNVLYSMKQSSDDANDAATSASITSGAAMGIAAGARR